MAELPATRKRKPSTKAIDNPELSKRRKDITYSTPNSVQPAPSLKSASSATFHAQPPPARTSLVSASVPIEPRVEDLEVDDDDDNEQPEPQEVESHHTQTVEISSQASDDEKESRGAKKASREETDEEELGTSITTIYHSPYSPPLDLQLALKQNGPRQFMVFSNRQQLSMKGIVALINSNAQQADA